MWQQRRTIKDLDLALHEAQNRWIRVEKARKSVPTNTGEFAARIAALQARIDALQLRLVDCRAEAERLSRASSRWRELQGQKDRLATYQVQARYALATMYDRAANPPAADRQSDAARAAPEGRAARRSRASRSRSRNRSARPTRSRSHERIAARTCSRLLVPLRARGAEERRRRSRISNRSPVEVRTDAQVSASSAKAMENYRRFLELQKTDPQLRAEAMRRLGDLNLEAGELERMESEVTQIDLQGGEAIKLYSTLLKAYPNYPRNDQVLYQLARAYETTGQPEQALATLDRVVQKYPRSPAAGRSAVPPRRAAVLRQALRRGAATPTPPSSRAARRRRSTSRASTSTAGRCSSSR